MNPKPTSNSTNLNQSIKRHFNIQTPDTNKTFTIDLIVRQQEGFTTGGLGIGAFTRKGYYQPSAKAPTNTQPTPFLIDHGTLDLKSKNDVNLYLKNRRSSLNPYRSLNRNGIEIICEITPDRRNIEIFQLTLNGKPIPPAMLSPYTRGRIKLLGSISDH